MKLSKLNFSLRMNETNWWFFFKKIFDLRHFIWLTALRKLIEFSSRYEFFILDDELFKTKKLRIVGLL